MKSSKEPERVAPSSICGSARRLFQTSFVPNSSHFRLVTLTSVGNRPIAPAHRHMYLPQWKFSEQYEDFFSKRTLPFHTEDIAYTLQHVLAKVNESTGVQYTRVLTRNGREVRSLSELPDFHTIIVLATEDDPCREQSCKKPLPRLRSTSRSTTSIPFRQSMLRSASIIQVKCPIEEISLKGANVRGSVRRSCVTQDPSPKREMLPQNAFAPRQVESLQREYTRLRHISLVEKVNDAVKSSSRLPGNVRAYLQDVKQKVIGHNKDAGAFAMYLRDAVPVLRGKPQNVFRAILQGLGSDGKHLTWSQWLLLNSLLVYDTATESAKVHFVCRMLERSYMDLLVLLTSLFQGERKNQQFQVVFAQLKHLFSGQEVTFAELQHMCESGEIDYEMILGCLRECSK